MQLRPLWPRRGNCGSDCEAYDALETAHMTHAMAVFTAQRICWAGRRRWRHPSGQMPQPARPTQRPAAAMAPTTAGIESVCPCEQTSSEFHETDPTFAPGKQSARRPASTLDVNWY